MKLKPFPFALLLALPPALLAVFQLGRLHPDEVFQALEPANWRAFGYGILAWEWQVGLRNWALPGLLGWLLKFGEALGIHDPQARRALLEVPQWLLHAASVLAVYRLCLRRLMIVPAVVIPTGAPLAVAATPSLDDGGAANRLAHWGAVLYASYGILWHFAGRTMGEGISAAILVIALERLDLGRAQKAPFHAALAGGALLGLAVVARYGSAIFVIGAIAWVLVQRRFKDAGLAIAGGLVIAFALGALDLLTWGKWFHSLREYADFNVLTDKAAQQFGREPATYYLPHLGWLALWAWPSFVRAGLKQTFSTGLFAVPAVLYLAALSNTPHKEVRFLYPGLVLLLVAAIPLFLEWMKQLGPERSARLLVAATVVSTGTFFFPSQFEPQRPEQFRLVLKAGRDATGLILVNEGVWGAPGFFWLGKNIPWFPCDFAEDPRFQQAVRTPTFNRAVIWDDRALAELQQFGFQVLETQGPGKLLGR